MGDIKMKNIYRTIALSCAAVSLCALSFAQSSEEEAEDQLVLPEVTTTVSGDSLSAGREAIPDFSDVILDASDSTGVLPVLPGVEMNEVPDEPVADLTYGSDSQVYSEGLIGGGYPGYFTGDFSIYQNSGEEPFLLRFSQLTENGYGRHAASEGYFDSSTLLTGGKTLLLGPLSLNLNGTYTTSTVGFQSLSPSFYSMTRQDVGTDDKLTWNLPLGFALSLAADFDWYSRYSGVIKDVVDYTSQEAEASVIYLSPVFEASWHNDFLKAGLSAEYNLETFTEEMDAETAGTFVINRGEFTGNFFWNNDFLSAGVKAGVIIGTEIGDNLPVIPPVLLCFNGEWDVPYAPSTIKVNLEGGLDSYLPEYGDLEQNCLFAAQYYLPGETSDWNAVLNLSVPVISMLTVDGDFTFRKTAFGNGVWEPTYGTSSSNGMYTFTEVDRTLFDTRLALNFAYNIVTLKLDWLSHWIYVPSTETKFNIGFCFNVDAENSLWGLDASLHENLGDNADYTPVFDFGGYYRLQESIRLACEVNDAVKLVTGKDRTYCNSQYSRRAGSATLLIKFFF